MSCGREFPDLEKVRSELEAKGVSFLALSIDQDVERVEEFVKRYRISMPVATTDDSVLGPLGLRTVPSTVFLDRNGVIIEVATGPHSESYFRERVESLLE